MKTRDEKIFIIMEEMADKTISFWLEILDEEDNIYKTVSVVFTAWWRKEFVDEKRKEEYYIEFAWYGWDVSVNRLKDKCKIIWHPLYPHHILQRAEKNNISIEIDRQDNWVRRFWIWYDWTVFEYIIPRDLSKDLYGQSDETVKALADLILKVKGDDNN